MEATEMEQIIIHTLTDVEHPRIREVDAFRDLSGSDRTGVRVTDSDGSRGFVQVVT